MASSSGSDPSTGQRASVDLEVRYAETDQMGVVHHSVYAVWYEVARTRLCEATGYHYAEIEAMGYNLVVAALETRYLSPARYGDVVTVDCWLERFSSRLLRFGYTVRRGPGATADSLLLATGATQHVWVEAGQERSRRIPESLRPAFESLQSKPPGP